MISKIAGELKEKKGWWLLWCLDMVVSRGFYTGTGMRQGNMSKWQEIKFRERPRDRWNRSEEVCGNEQLFVNSNNNCCCLQNDEIKKTLDPFYIKLKYLQT